MRQLESAFVAGDPLTGYYNDLRPHLSAYVAHVSDADAAVLQMTADRGTANPVTVAQLGLGAWQRASEDGAWLACVDAVTQWLVGALEPDGALTYRFPLRGTYDVASPWVSAMAQGEAASLLVRASAALQRPELLDAAVDAIRPLLVGRDGIVAHTREGPVLEEYPTTPPSHVLNGWIYALWGLYDVAHSPARHEDAAELFRRSVDALARRLPLYELPGRWTRYDLFPHPIPNVASPFYHALHVAQLRALARLADDRRIAATAVRWQGAAQSPLVNAAAVAGKVAFRLVRPRQRRTLSLRR
jgi:hypothetical protein